MGVGVGVAVGGIRVEVGSGVAVGGIGVTVDSGVFDGWGNDPTDSHPVANSTMVKIPNKEVRRTITVFSSTCVMKIVAWGYNGKVERMMRKLFDKGDY
jgi:hypothetical protein